MTVIRLAEAADLPAVAGLRWDEIGAGTGDREDFVAAFVQWAAEHRGTHRCVVAERAGRLIGMAWLATVDRAPDLRRTYGRCSGDVQTVFVRPVERGAGVGRLLVDEVVRLARADGFQHLTVHSGRRAVTLYGRAGFDAAPTILLHPLQS